MPRSSLQGIWLNFFFPQPMEVAVFISRHWLIPRRDMEFCFWFLTRRKLLEHSTMLCFQVNPHNIMPIQHRMLKLPYFYQDGVPMSLYHWDMFFPRSVRCVRFQFLKDFCALLLPRHNFHRYAAAFLTFKKIHFPFSFLGAYRRGRFP